MAEKEFKTYRQLLSILRERGLNINTGSQGSRVMRILESENYYNVVNGYKEFFLAPRTGTTTNETYISGATFDEIHAFATRFAPFCKEFSKTKNATIPRYLSTILKLPLLFGCPLQPKALLYGSNAIVLFTNAG